jgi:hypothetical protein
MRFLVAGSILALSMFFVIGSNGAADKDKKEPKYKIADVMKIAMKGGLCGKVAKGDASDEEKAKLVELFTALSQNTPPKGDADSWKEKTGALLKAAKAGDGAALKKAANCGACHKAHKG